MSYSPSRRTSFEAALNRSLIALYTAHNVADLSGDESVVNDLSEIRSHIASMVNASMDERRSAMPRPIKGQTTIDQ